VGVIVKSTCGRCNYSTRLMIECGLTSLKQNWMPALNIIRKEIISINTNDSGSDEGNLIFRSDLTLNKKPFFRLIPAQIKGE
jgi:hypothetical protein